MRALVELEIEGFGYSGEGYARLPEGFVSVPRALPGERIEARIGDFVRGRAWAELVRVLTPAHQRVEPDCPHFARCSGCALRHLSRPDERALKLDQAAQILQRYGPAQRPPTVGWVGSESRLGHRARGRFAVEAGDDGFVVGLRGVDLERSLVDVRDCPAQAPRFRELMVAFAAALEQHPEAAAVTAIEIEVSEGHGRVSLNATERLDETALSDLIALAEREGVGLVLRRDATSETLTGSAILALKLRSGTPHSRSGAPPQPTLELPLGVWHHASPELGQRLADWVVARVTAVESPRVLDLCCGVGTLTARLAPISAAVLAIDESRLATEALRAALSRASVENVEVRSGRIGAVLRKLRRDPDCRAGLAVINPMRRPLGERQLRDLPALGVRRVIYLGPAPVSAARDAAVLSALGFQLSEATVVDLHPGTAQFMLGIVADR